MNSTTARAVPPGSDGEYQLPDGGGPQVAVDAETAAGAAEILALVGELLRVSSGTGLRTQLARFLRGKGADPAYATDWLVSRIPALAAELHGAVAAEGISIDPGLDRYRGAGAGW